MEREYFQVGQTQYTRKEKLANWFYYNKLWILVGIIIFSVVLSMIFNALGIGQTKPDYCVSYVGRLTLPGSCVSALETELAAYGEDLNGDGVVYVLLIQHVITDDSYTDNMLYSYGAQITILADITDNVSYLFLLEDPAAFQNDFQILAHLDGSIPAEDDYEAADKVLLWDNCPALTALPLGTYEDTYLDLQETGDCQSLLSGLYLGRRYFHEDSAPKNLAAYEAFWEALTEGATK